MGTDPDAVGDQVVSLVLASGEGSRFDGIKQLAKVDGVPMIIAVCNRQLAVSGHVIVVLGANAEEIGPLLQSHGIPFVFNDSWRDGMSTSILRGIEHVESRLPEASAILITLGDQPYIPVSAFQELIDANSDHPGKIVASEYGGTIGVPAIFPKSHWVQLKSLTGDKGARAILRNSTDVVTVTVPEASLDVDTSGDLI